MTDEKETRIECGKPPDREWLFSIGEGHDILIYIDYDTDVSIQTSGDVIIGRFVGVGFHQAEEQAVQYVREDMLDEDDIKALKAEGLEDYDIDEKIIDALSWHEIVPGGRHSTLYLN